MPAFYCLRCMRKVKSSTQAHRLKDGSWCGGIEPTEEQLAYLNETRIATTKKPPLKVNAIRADGKRECPVCTNSYKPSSGDYPVVAHFDWGAHRWCPGGRPPTPEQKASRRVRGASVRTISGGLPEQGRR